MHSFAALGRLKPGINATQAEADLKVIAARLREEYPNTNTRVDVWIDPLMKRALGGMTGTLVSLLIIVGFVLLIGCANIASMLLAKGASRQTEVAIRASLGAGARRIIRQLLTESMLLSLIGGIVGIVMALWSLGTLKGLMPATQARVDGIVIDWWVLLFAFVVMAAAGVIFGLAPALFAARTDLTGTLAGGGGSRGGSRKRNRMLNGLVTVQLAIALMLVNAAILLFMSYVNATNEPQGFDTENILVVNLEISGPEYEEAAGRYQFWDRLIARVGAAPGVMAVGATTRLPTRGGTNGSVLVEGEAHDLETDRPLVELKLVTPGYFDVMGIDIVRGRNFDSGEMIVDPDVTSGFSPGMNGIVIVNQAFVDRYWTESETDPIGQVIRANSAEPGWSSRVIGVAEDVRQWNLTQQTLPERYHPFSLQTWSTAFLVLRTERDPGSFVSLVREAVYEIDPLIPVDSVFTMEEFIHSRLQGSRVATLLVGLFTVVAVMLALSGTWGVMSFRVAQRTQEIGIRIAFGASRRQIVWHFIRQGFKLAGLGGLIGVTMTVTLIAVLSANVFGIQPVEGLYLLLAFIVLVGLMFLASALPAMKATRVDPVEALRVE
jgi:putative ABC transport system permease protein